MQEEWWEGIVTFICQYGWILLIIIVLAITAYFTRSLWMPALGIG